MKLELTQNTPEWLAERRKRIGASDAAICLGISPWTTPYELWLQKTGRLDNEPKKEGGSVSWAIDRGNRFEPKARARYELHNDIDLPATTLVHPTIPYMMASLDGWNEERKIALEIKVPGKSTFEKAKDGVVVPHYAVQLEHQIAVSGAVENHFFCVLVERVDGREIIVDDALIVYKSKPRLMDEVLKANEKFWQYVQTDTPPPLTEKDYLVLEDQKAKEVFNEIALSLREIEAHETAFKEAEFIYHRAKEELDLQRTRQRNLEESALGCFSHQRVKCAGVLAHRKVLKSGEERITFKLV